jgi:hypothetical protein
MLMPVKLDSLTHLRFLILVILITTDTHYLLHYLHNYIHSSLPYAYTLLEDVRTSLIVDMRCVPHYCYHFSILGRTSNSNVHALFLYSGDI